MIIMKHKNCSRSHNNRCSRYHNNWRSRCHNNQCSRWVIICNDKDSESKTQSNDPRILSGKQLASKYLFNGRDMPAYESMYNAKVEIITTDTVDGQNLAWRVVRPLNAHEDIKNSYRESKAPIMHVGFSNTDKRDFFGYFDKSIVVDGKMDGPGGADPWTAYHRHTDVMLDKYAKTDAFSLEHGYNQEILTQARKNIDFSWNRKINENVEKYYWANRNCWHYMHAVEQEYVKLGGVLYLCLLYTSDAADE